jgi:hypothetical protein
VPPPVPLQDLWAFDVRLHTWQPLPYDGCPGAAAPPVGSPQARSHACLASGRGGTAALCIGGARYFQGVYFNEAALLAGKAAGREPWNQLNALSVDGRPRASPALP